MAVIKLARSRENDRQQKGDPGILYLPIQPRKGSLLCLHVLYHDGGLAPSTAGDLRPLNHDAPGRLRYEWSGEISLTMLASDRLSQYLLSAVGAAFGGVSGFDDRWN